MINKTLIQVTIGDKVLPERVVLGGVTSQANMNKNAKHLFNLI